MITILTAWLLASLLAVSFTYCASRVSGNAENPDRDE